MQTLKSLKASRPAQDRASLVCFNVDGARLSRSHQVLPVLGVESKAMTGKPPPVVLLEAATRTIWPPWSIRTPVTQPSAGFDVHVSQSVR